MATVRACTTEELDPELLDAIHRLMLDAFAEEFTDEDWDHTLGGQHFLIVEGDEALSHAAVVQRTLYVGERALRAGYVEGVATLPGRHNEGLGSLVMAATTAFIKDGFEIGGLGTDRFTFYERLGWEKWEGPTHVRRADGVVRSPDEDGYVMVLRFGTSKDLDLSHPIACEERAGEDW
jgi:aminoglycoside 2'-N-acetyltransferase I